MLRRATPDSLVAEGVRLHRSFETEAALGRYVQALAADSRHYRALWHAAAESVVLGMTAEDESRAFSRYAAAEAYARRALEVNPGGTEAMGWLAVALGRKALSAGVREAVRLAEEIRSMALQAIELDPQSPLGHHVLGQWHAEVRRVGGVQRLIARAVLGGKSFGEASWDMAETHLARSTELEPESLVHRIELARVYQETGREELARSGYEWVLAQPLREPTDAGLQSRARRLLADLGSA